MIARATFTACVGALLLGAHTTNALASFLTKLPHDGAGFGQALGHVGTDSGKRNVFGEAFGVAMDWAQICKLDSDGDGLTNGQELGDPCCKWSSGNDAVLVTGKYSHPGDATSKTTDTSLLNANCGGSNPTNTSAPTTAPTAAPTTAPTTAPTSNPTTTPSSDPTYAPTPTTEPSVEPTFAPRPTNSTRVPRTRKPHCRPKRRHY